jgi:hypothetical protein
MVLYDGKSSNVIIRVDSWFKFILIVYVYIITNAQNVTAATEIEKRRISMQRGKFQKEAE